METFTINIRDMVFEGCHGVNEHEKRIKQPFRVSITLLVDGRGIGGDSIQGTVNWSRVRNCVGLVVETRSFALVERLAWEILDTVLRHDERISQVIVTVEKPEAWSDRNGTPGITMAITRLCGLCGRQATWVRYTQFSGNHYFCLRHAEKESDFGQEDPSYFVWKKLA